MDDLPEDIHTVEDLLEVADRFLLDSARLTDLSVLPRIGSLCVRHPGCSIGDFNWARLDAWRELTAKFFDAPSMASHLLEISELEVEYAVAGSLARPAQALLFAGWLATCLDWRKTARLGQGEWRLQAPQGEVRLRLRGRRAKGVQAGELVSIRLKGRSTSFDIRRGADPQALISASDADGARLERTVRIQPYGEVEVLSANLRVVDSERVFEETLAIASSLTAH
jgi:glucose-6-phosphate dehydrogenase assembly protein OpcA